MSATDIFWHLTSSDHDMLWFSPQTSFSTSEVISMWDGEQGGLPEIGLCDRIYAPRTKKHGFWRDQNMVIRWSRFFHGFRRDTIAVINVWLRFLCFFVSLFKCVLKWRSYVGPMSDFEYFDFEIFKANTWHVMMQQTSLRVHRILLWRSTTDFLRSAVLRQLLTPWCLLTTVLGF